jgi:hypothetical protein
MLLAFLRVAVDERPWRKASKNEDLFSGKEKRLREAG